MPKSSKSSDTAPKSQSLVVDLDSLQEPIRWGLQQLRKGDLFVKIGLMHSDFDKVVGDDTHRKRFWSVVADHVLEQAKPKELWNKHDKKRRKAILHTLEANKQQLLQFLQDEYPKLTPSNSTASTENNQQQQPDDPILEEDSKPSATTNKKKKKKKKKTENQQLEATQDDAPDDDGALEDSKPPATLKKKKKLKKKIANPETTQEQEQDETPSNNMDEMDPNDYKRLQKARAEVKIEFQRKQNQILSQVPQATRDMFSQIYFSKWKKDYLPVLVLSPYDVPPGQVRQNWMTMFKKVKDQGRLQNMTNLCFWFGTIEMSAAYSFVPTKSLIPYHVGVKKNYHKLPAAIAAKLKDGKKLHANEAFHVRALKDMEEDLKKEPHQRKRGIIDFPEEYDLVTMSDLEEPTTADASDDDDDDDEQQEAKTPKRKRASTSASKPKPKRRRLSKAEPVEDPMDVEPTQDDDEKPKKKKTKKRLGKTAKSKDSKKDESKDDKVEDSDGDDTPVPPKKKDKKGRPVLDRKKSKKKKQAESTPATTTEEEEEATPSMEVDDMANFGDAEESHNEDDGEKDESVAPSSDEDDGDYEEQQAPKLSKKAATTKTTPKKKTKKPKTKKQPPEPAPRTAQEEQQRFEECEDRFLPCLERLGELLRAKDTKALAAALEDMCKDIDTMTTAFIVAYGVHSLMKDIKSLLKKLQDGGKSELETFRKVWGKLKAIYETKGESCPDFVPKKRSPPIKMEMDDTPDESVSRRDDVPVKAKKRSPIKIEMDDKPDDTVSRRDDLSTKAKKEDLQSPDKKEDVQSPVKTKKEETTVRRRSNDSATGRELEATKRVPKPTKSKFSLGRLMRPTPKEQQQSKVTAEEGRPGKPLAKKIPLWMTTKPSTEAPKDDKTRCHALEFLTQAASRFPDEQVNVEYAGRALEVSIYNWAQQETTNWEDLYWDKVHEIVAAICGKLETGSVVYSIMEGEIAAPEDVVELSEQVLLDSFEGRPITLP